MLTTLLLIQLLATGFMTGLIWFVQVVHYPLFARVGSGEFVAYEDEHVRRTTLIVAPAMLIEAASSLALLLIIQGDVQRLLAWLGAAMLCVIWLSTALLQVPCHRQLSSGFASTTVERLSVSNWIRTLAWTARLIIASAMLVQAMPA